MRSRASSRVAARRAPQPPPGHALLVPSLTDLFELIGVSASVWHGRWRAIHLEPNILRFELRYGTDLGRVRYNERCIDDARRTRRVVVGRYGGFLDFFVPIITGSDTDALLVAGPIADTRPESTTILERWHALTGRQGHAADAELAEYVSQVLATLVLDARGVEAFQAYLVCLARMMAGTGNAKRLSARAEPLRSILEGARYVERTWDAAHSMVDERTTRSWPTPQRLEPMQAVGLERAPDQVLVALMVSANSEWESVDELVRRDAFQRACVELARDKGNAISGKVGDTGVSFLSAAAGSTEARRRRLLELGEAATRLARRSGFDLYLGTSGLQRSSTLATAFQAALGAAESGLTRRVRVVSAATRGEIRPAALGDLRRDLAKLAEEQPRALAPRFERYLEAVGHLCGYRLELAQVHLEVGFERVAQAFVDRETLGEKSYRDMFDDLARAAREARTVHDLFNAYRRAVLDIIDAIERPTTARRDRSLRRALAYIQRHYTEPLALPEVAKIAGFADNYFSQLFKRREKTTFERYLRELRVERAKHLLGSTELPLQRVAALSGFSSPSYFATVFRLSVGVAPSEYKRQTTPKQAFGRRAATRKARRPG